MFRGKLIMWFDCSLSKPAYTRGGRAGNGKGNGTQEIYIRVEWAFGREGKAEKEEMKKAINIYYTFFKAIILWAGRHKQTEPGSKVCLLLAHYHHLHFTTALQHTFSLSQTSSTVPARKCARFSFKLWSKSGVLGFSVKQLKNDWHESLFAQMS